MIALTLAAWLIGILIWFIFETITIAFSLLWGAVVFALEVARQTGLWCLAFWWTARERRTRADPHAVKYNNYNVISYVD